ncbi:MAG TPA: squalene/phytoene synthase family protein, partial [Verrucomicrobiales bacterium]|nr:squalene/phytoene synthase family protein [Verrucomicrobiales bacterium]
MSRSFYLSIIFLPKRMQEPVALGYLLARASDTVADTTNLPPAERLAWLDQMEAAVKEISPDGLPGLARAIGPRQSHEGEKALLERL